MRPWHDCSKHGQATRRILAWEVGTTLIRECALAKPRRDLVGSHTRVAELLLPNTSCNCQDDLTAHHVRPTHGACAISKAMSNLRSTNLLQRETSSKPTRRVHVFCWPGLSCGSLLIMSSRRTCVLLASTHRLGVPQWESTPVAACMSTDTVLLRLHVVRGATGSPWPHALPACTARSIAVARIKNTKDFTCRATGSI